jgi:ribosomal-protein-alanine acetyltransferase
MRLTVVAGEQPFLYWRGELPSDGRIRFLELVREVRPLYVEANLVIVPTMVSAGTNLKVLEAMAMERAVVSTSSGCAGLGLEHGVSVWIADQAQAFADGIAHLIANPELRRSMAGVARVLAERNFDWRQLGKENRRLLREVISSSSRIRIRTATKEDLEAIARLQAACPEGAPWPLEACLSYDCRLATVDGRVAGLLATQAIAQDQWEILNLAVDPAFRRRGVATELLCELVHWSPGEIFLEVRESNAAARNLYKKLGFSEVGLRPAYYQNPPEAAIVMRLRSC